MNLSNPSSNKKPTGQGTTDSPYLGSKISLVSKAKIRYEGILYTIDANESTVALSKVRSFGTEDRPTDRPVAAREEVFDYIIFRGADIEDLQVREPPQASLTQDPAIVESSINSSSTRSTNPSTLNNLGGNQNRSSTNQGNIFSSNAQPGSNKPNKPYSNNDPLRHLNSNQQTQSTRSNNQQGQYDGQDHSYGNQRRSVRQQQDYYNDFSSNSNNNNRRGNQNQNQKYAYGDWSRANNSGWDNGYRQQPQRYSRQPQQQQQQNYDSNRGYPSRRPNTGQQSNGYYSQRERRNSTGGITGNPQNQTRPNRQQRQRADSIRGNSNGRSALKFIGDFDFEKSNAEFNKNAIEDELKKSLSIKPNNDKENTTTSTEKENTNDQKTQPTPDQPSTTASVDKTDQPDQEGNPDGFYDKQKSFFDRISCETTEKDKTNNPRRNRNEERRINAETFGLKYRPAPQGGNQRNGQSGYYNNRRNNNGQQSYYGNGGRYQRGGSGGNGGNYTGGQQQQQQQQSQRGRNNTYYGNPNNRMRAY